MGDFIFDLQRFTDVTVTPTATSDWKDGSTITVTFQDQNGSNVTATFTYNATTNSFNETHSVSSFLAAAHAAAKSITKATALEAMDFIKMNEGAAKVLK